MKADNKLFRLLSRQHREVDAMLTEIQEAEDVATCRTVYPKMRAELLAHARAEEKTFYAALERAGERQDAKLAKSEHRAIEKALGTCDSLDYDDERWADAVEELVETFRAHVSDEEGEVFTAAAEAIDRKELDQLVAPFEDAREALLEELRSVDELSTRTKHELLELAREHDIEGRSRMTKDELIAALGQVT